jgi:alpha-tubulin suppressor-like RCC1 family protein
MMQYSNDWSQFCGRSVYSVGCGLGGKLGHGSRSDEKYPRLIEQFQTLNIQPVVVAAGAWHAAVVGKDGRVCTWGWGRYGCLGHGNEECESVPKVVETLSSVKAVHVATGDYTTFVVSHKGDVYSFGCGESSSLGHNTAIEVRHYLRSPAKCLMETCNSEFCIYHLFDPN